ncbi:MAG: sugar nucleotide-binding protein [Porticoccaceae bacterium]|nr:sugar nucleotide-binding protein [Porticoccaceae bacterium]MDG1306600.1 sugar nucleotide-binding protein [Porticoccaceae bacterium]
MKILLAGCGDLGRRTGTLLAPRHQCFGLRRHPQNLPETILPIAGNMTEPRVLTEILNQGFDVVVVTLTPDEFTEQAYRQSYVAGANALFTAIERVERKPSLVIWVSSTSVYGNNQGDWVDEQSPTNPTSFSGKLLLEAEQQIQRLSCAHSVVRFSGIYGPGRTRMLSQVRAGIGRPAVPEQWSNRIHSEDCAGVLTHLIERFAEGRSVESLYLATDCAPVTQHEMRNWLAAQMQVVLADEMVVQNSIRRCRNQRLLDSGYEFIYPSYKEGYLALMAE